MDSTITCYNCYKEGYYASSCPKPKRVDLKEIKEDLLEELGKEELGKEDL